MTNAIWMKAAAQLASVSARGAPNRTYLLRNHVRAPGPQARAAWDLDWDFPEETPVLVTKY
jgi:hypothetical protein